MSQGGERPLLEQLDERQARIGSEQREMLRLIARADRERTWWDSGARDLPHFLSMRYGISHWKARRWVAAAHALEQLPAIARALMRGELSMDKLVELTRFASPDTEARLIGWAQRVSAAAVRRRADLETRRSLEDTRQAERDRFLSWWYVEDRFGLEVELPAAQGAVVARAIERVAASIPVMPGEEESLYAAARRADALVGLCSARLSADAEPDRATVVIHAPLAALEGRGGAEIEGGAVIHPETARASPAMQGSRSLQKTSGGRRAS